jgi:hypothetical protein
MVLTPFAFPLIRLQFVVDGVVNALLSTVFQFFVTGAKAISQVGSNAYIESY